MVHYLFPSSLESWPSVKGGIITLHAR